MTSNLILALILLLGGVLQTIPAHGGSTPYEPAHNIARHNQVGSGDNIAFWPLLSADRSAGIAEENRIPNLMRIDRIDDMQSCGICHEYRRGYLPGDIFAGWRGCDRNFPESNTFKFWTSLCLKAVHHRAADTCLPKWICSKIQDIGHSMARVETDSRNLTFLRLGGVLQIEAERRPGHEPAHNIAVSPDAAAADGSADKLPAQGDHDRFHGHAFRCADRFRPVPVTGILLPEYGVLDKLSSQSIQIWNAACLRQSQQFFGTDISAASVKWSGTISDVLPYAVQTLQLRHGLMGTMVRICGYPADLTSSKLGGVLYCTDEGRWLPDVGSQAHDKRATERDHDRCHGEQRILSGFRSGNTGRDIPCGLQHDRESIRRILRSIDLCGSRVYGKAAFICTAWQSWSLSKNFLGECLAALGKSINLPSIIIGKEVAYV